MPTAYSKKSVNKCNVRINPNKYRDKIPHLSSVNGKAQVDPDSKKHQKWFEEFKK